MTKESNSQKSLIERIYDDMFRIIEEAKKFNEVEIQNLREIAYENNFKKEKSIVEAIKSGEKEEK
ncbi:hypothetical protein LCGC14_1027450 [marine sediment metagenome]|uniref:Uncharacterized protein n=1 Tax=marine sediment metagenome TaxID=412755 RepID=A0A0F9NHE3_9ZZZZ